MRQRDTKVKTRGNIGSLLVTLEKSKSQSGKIVNVTHAFFSSAHALPPDSLAVLGSQIALPTYKDRPVLKTPPLCLLMYTTQ